MLNRKQLAGEAVAKALWARKRLGVPLENSICPIDSAESLNIEVRLVDLPSMEGMYIAGEAPRILLSCLRPQGRRAFTCAHEIGHHVFRHGQQFDEMKGDRSARRIVDPKEFSADSFATYFLMPKATVDSGMARRRFSYALLKGTQAYSMASWLGVGYRTFVNHLYYGLGQIKREHADQLRKWEPRTLRAEILGRSVSTHLHLVDRAWTGRAIDCEAGDYLLIPKGSTCEGAVLGPTEPIAERSLLQIQHPGLARVSDKAGNWAAFVRASRQQYVGRSRYRFEEEVDE